MSCKWAKGTGGPAGDEYQNLVTTETVGTLCSDTHPGAYSGQDAYTGRLVPMKAKNEPFTLAIRGRQGGESLEYRQDGTANTILTANGGRSGMGVGAVCFTAGNLARGAGANPSSESVGTLLAQHGRSRTDQEPLIAFHPTQDPISSTDGTIHTLGCGSSSGCATGAVAFAQNTRDEVRLVGGDGQVVGALAVQPGMKQTTYVAMTEGAQRTGDGTLSARTQGGGGLGTDCELDGGLQPVGAMQVRRLTPRETNRLQAFPDDWNAEGIDKQGRRIVMADSSRYKQMGNAVTVTVAQAIAERVAMVLRRSS